MSSWRKQQRQALLAARADVSNIQREQATAAIQQMIRATLALFSPGILAIYWPIKGEVDCRNLAADLMLAGWQLSVPVIDNENQKLEFAEWTPTTPMQNGIWNVPIPISLNWLQPDIYLVPLVGFDQNLYRLGYGAGYYDRTFANINKPIQRIGIGLEQGRLLSIEPHELDIPMDMIITESGLYRHSTV